MCELGTSICHGKRSRTCTVLRLDNFVTTELDAVDKLIIGSAGNAFAISVMGEQWHYGGAGMATHDGYYCVPCVITRDLAKEACSANNVEGGNTEDTAWIKDA